MCATNPQAVTGEKQQSTLAGTCATQAITALIVFKTENDTKARDRCAIVHSPEQASLVPHVNLRPQRTEPGTETARFLNFPVRHVNC